MKSLFHICLLVCVCMAGPRQILAQDTNPPASQPPTSGTSTNPPHTNPPTPPRATNEPVATITGILPGAPLLGPNQPLTIIGSNFPSNAVVRFSDVEEHDYPAEILQATNNRLIVVATFGTAGQWKVSLVNSSGTNSATFKFQVANTPVPTWDLRAKTFVGVAVVVTLLLAYLVLQLVHGLKKVENDKQWSFGDALSEESIYQPKEITAKKDVILIASTSRLIALLGLMGILTIIVGIGYAIMWNLFLYGTVPDLKEVRAFLYGAACLFAPYLANQLSGVFTPSAKPQPAGASGSTAAAPSITGLAPAPFVVGNQAKALLISGTGFENGLMLALADPQNLPRTVDASAITVHPTIINANLVLDTAGEWSLTVQNSVKASSQSFKFTVTGPPTITGIDPTELSNQTTEQEFTFKGSGFMSGIAISLANPAGAAIPITMISLTSSTLRVKTTLATAGAWTVNFKNPNSNPLSYPLRVT